MTTPAHPDAAHLRDDGVRALAPDAARHVAATFDLAHLPPSFYADPYPTYHALREHEPVRRMPDGSWFLTRYDDVLPVYRDPRAQAIQRPRVPRETHKCRVRWAALFAAPCRDRYRDQGR